MGACHSRSNNEDQIYSIIGTKATNYKFNDADYIFFAFHGDLMRIKLAVQKNEIPDLFSVRGYSQHLKLHSHYSQKIEGYSSSGSLNSDLQDQDNSSSIDKGLNTIMWNPVLFAVYNNQLEVVKFLFNESDSNNYQSQNNMQNASKQGNEGEKQFKVNQKLLLRGSEFQKERQSVPDKLQQYQKHLGLIISISNRDSKMLDYLLNSLHYLWNQKTIVTVIQKIIKMNWTQNSLNLVLQGKCFLKLMDEMESNPQQQIQFLHELFGIIFQSWTDEELDENEEIKEGDDVLIQQLQDLKLKKSKQMKWRQIIFKLFINSKHVIILGLYLINHNFYKAQNMYFKLASSQIKDKSQMQCLNQLYLDQLVKDFALLDPNVRVFYERVQELIHHSLPIKVMQEDNYGITFLRMIKDGDLLGIQGILSKLRKLNLEEIYDDFGEIDFSEEELDSLMKQFQTQDASIVRKINPIQMALIYNQQHLLQLLIEKMGLVLRRKHIKAPNYKDINESHGLMLFKMAIEFRHYSIFTFIWDNYSHLFTRQDLQEGIDLIVTKKDNFLTKYILNSSSTHQFFNIFSFAYKFVFLSETIFKQLTLMKIESPSTTNSKKIKEYLNMTSSELSKQPYSFYSFALFYERGDIYECLKSLEETNIRDIRLFVKHNPKSSEKFLLEILTDDVAMKLHQNANGTNVNDKERKEDLNYVEFVPSMSKVVEQRMKDEFFVNKMRSFRDAMNNLGKIIQMEIKLLGTTEEGRTQTKSSEN